MFPIEELYEYSDAGSILCDVPKFLITPEEIYVYYTILPPPDLYEAFNILTVEVIGDLLNEVLCYYPPLEYALNCD